MHPRRKHPRIDEHVDEHRHERRQPRQLEVNEHQHSRHEPPPGAVALDGASRRRQRLVVPGEDCYGRVLSEAVRLAPLLAPVPARRGEDARVQHAGGADRRHEAGHKDEQNVAGRVGLAELARAGVGAPTERRQHAEEDGVGPRGDDGGGRPSAGHQLPVAQRVLDGHVAVDGNGEDVSDGGEAQHERQRRRVHTRRVAVEEGGGVGEVDGDDDAAEEHVADGQRGDEEIGRRAKTPVGADDDDHEEAGHDGNSHQQPEQGDVKGVRRVRRCG